MKTIQTKIDLKRKKKVIDLLNHISSLDETVINIFGNRHDPYFVKIYNSFELALSKKIKLCTEIRSMDGLSGRKFRVLLNNLIRTFEYPKYLEIGSWLGSTACSACYKNDLEMTCIDNWSQNFSNNLDPKKTFKKNIKNYITKNSKFRVIEKDFRQFNFNLLEKINIYFYDGSHNYEDHFDSVKLILPSLANKFIFIVDDWNWRQVREGTLDAIKKQKLRVVSGLEIKTTDDDSSSLVTGSNSDWHQGVAFFVIEK